jgi:2-hydroxychromene-2-carboxylate isomerase
MRREKTLDFWFDFASTYSYPAAQRIGRLASKARVKVRFRPFLLGPIFQTQGWETSPFNLYEAKGRHMWRDLERLCADLGLPFRRPDPFPQNSLLAARVALAGLAENWGDKNCDDKSWGGDFCRAVFRAEFGDGRRIDDAATITDVLAGLQIEAEPVLAAAQSDAIKAQLRAQTEAAERLGIFGAPSFTTADGELFWGNDRLEQALRWASSL